MTEEELFHAALARPEAERSSFLEQACSGNASLRAAVEALLAAHEAFGSFLNPASSSATPFEGSLDATQDPSGASDGEQATLGGRGSSAGSSRDERRSESSQAEHPRADLAGLVIGGRYTLQERIGEGGMGEVWAAKQTEPIKRKVAVKLIKSGMDSRAVLQRFEQERQALALMDHPHIARVLDGGMTSTGQPYFVMELVNGLPLTKFCDELKLTLPARLELFVPICQAVQHAHQKGIVHRDLKPANILVTMVDGRPVPKVIDFGVAKATSGKLTEETMSTGFGAIVGTLEYMSPEQAGFTSDDVDTRADIYSLGVILYELLTGLRPIDGNRLKKAAFTEMVRMIQEEDPSKPSTRLSANAALPSLAAVRQTEPRKLMALLRGELDWVVMKCLEKQRDRRYETANALARDIQRYLAVEPVEARPPSAGYRFSKFVRRNKGQVFAAGFVLVTLLAGIVGTTVGLVRTEAQREIAVAQQAIAEEQRVRAEQARDRTRDVLDAMTSQAIADSLGSQRTLSAEQKKFLTEVLSYYREFADEQAGDRETRARAADAAHRVGQIEQRLGRVEESYAATLVAHDGYAALAKEFPDRPEYRRDWAKSGANLGSLAAGLGKYAEAKEYLEQALTLIERLVAEYPAERQYRFDLAMNHTNLGTLLARLDDLAGAERQFRKSLELLEKLAGEFPAEADYREKTATVTNNLGQMLASQGKRVEAAKLYENSQGLLQKLTEEFPAVAEYRHMLATSHAKRATMLNGPEAQEQFARAIELLERLVAEFPTLPEYRESLAISYNGRGTLFMHLGRNAEALEQFRQTLTCYERLVSDFPAVPEHREHLASFHVNVGILFDRSDQLLEAEKQYRKALPVFEKLVEDYPDVALHRRELAACRTNLSLVLMRMRRSDEAESQARLAVEAQEKLVVDFPVVVSYRVDLGGSYCNVGLIVRRRDRREEALEWFAKGITTLDSVLRDDATDTKARRFLRSNHVNRGESLALLGRHREALVHWDRAIELGEKNSTRQYRAARAMSRLRVGPVEEAVAEVDELTKTSNWLARDWYDFACVYAVASGKLTQHRQPYADRALEMLRRALSAGLSVQVRWRENPDFESLRDRDDFQKLLADAAIGTSPPASKP